MFKSGSLIKKLQNNGSNSAFDAFYTTIAKLLVVLAIIISLSACATSNLVASSKKAPASSASPTNAEQVQSRIKASESLDSALLPGAIASKLQHGTMSGLAAHLSEILGLFPLTKSNLVVSVDAAGVVGVWDGTAQSGKKLTTLGQDLTCADLNEQHGQLAIALKNEVKILKFPELTLLYSWKDLRTRVVTCQLAPNGRSLLTGGNDGMIYRWRFAENVTDQTENDTSKLYEKYIAHPTVVSKVIFHPFGRVFFSADWDGVVNAWLRYDSDKFSGDFDKNIIGTGLFADDADRMTLSRLDTDTVEQLKLSKDGKVLLVGTQAGLIELWKVRGLKKVTFIQAHKNLIYDAVISNDGKAFASAGRDGNLRVFKVSIDPDPAGGPDLWSIKNTLELPGVSYRKLALRENESCVGIDAHGRVTNIPEVRF